MPFHRRETGYARRKPGSEPQPVKPGSLHPTTLPVEVEVVGRSRVATGRQQGWWVAGSEGHGNTSEVGLDEYSALRTPDSPNSVSWKI